MPSPTNSFRRNFKEECRKFIEQAGNEEFIYMVNPLTLVVECGSHQAQKKFGRLGIPNFVGMHVFVLILRSAIELYRNDPKNRDKFIRQQQLAWLRLIYRSDNDFTKHVFKWGRDGGGQEMSVGFEVVHDEAGNIDCYTVSVTAIVLSAEDYKSAEENDLLFIPAPEAMAA